MRLTSTADSGL